MFVLTQIDTFEEVWRSDKTALKNLRIIWDHNQSQF